MNRHIKKLVILFALSPCLPVRGQTSDGLYNECDSLRNASPPDLAQFLNGVIPDEKNGDCVSWALRKLGSEKYEAAIPTLVRLLDFRRPPTPREKLGFVMRIQGIWEFYPAAGALSDIGTKALPATLEVIKSSMSAIAKENAIFVWMEAHRDEQPKGIALLKQEQDKTTDGTTRQRLAWAISRALTWCNPPSQAGCLAAAKTGKWEAPTPGS